MANVKISELDPVLSLSGTDVLPVVASSATSKITLTNLANTFPQVSSSISSSYALTAKSSSYALTASYALNAGGAGTTPSLQQVTSVGNQTSASVVITGSLTHGLSVSSLGDYSHAEGYGNAAEGVYSHSEGVYTSAIGSGSHAEGNSTTAASDYSHAEGYSTTASGPYSHAEGDQTSAAAYSHAEGSSAQANGLYSHAEGFTTRANGIYSHAEGLYAIANGTSSHAEGIYATATGNGSHAEGAYTTAYGDSSHVEGWGTITSGAYQHVQGVWNVPSSRQAAFIIGNGSNITPSNLVYASGSKFEVTGSVNSTGGFTGSLFGTASWSNYAQTASYLNNLNQNLSITGSLIISGSPNPEIIIIGETTITGSLRISGSSALTLIGSGSITSGSLAVGNITPSSTVGRIDASNDIVAFSTSDIRLKTNVVTITGSINKINSISGVEFDWIPNAEIHGNTEHDVGVIAQEIEKVLPEVVTTRDNGYKAVKYEKIVPLLIEAIKDLQKQIDELKAKI